MHLTDINKSAFQLDFLPIEMISEILTHLLIDDVRNICILRLVSVQFREITNYIAQHILDNLFTELKEALAYSMNEQCAANKLYRFSLLEERRNRFIKDHFIKDNLFEGKLITKKDFKQYILFNYKYVPFYKGTLDLTQEKYPLPEAKYLSQMVITKDSKIDGILEFYIKSAINSRAYEALVKFIELLSNQYAKNICIDLIVMKIYFLAVKTYSPIEFSQLLANISLEPARFVLESEPQSQSLENFLKNVARLNDNLDLYQFLNNDVQENHHNF